MARLPRRTRGLRDQRYRAPNGKWYAVDAALDPQVLDRLNALPNLLVEETCAGHARGGERYARIVFTPDQRRPEARHDYPGTYVLLFFAPYLERLSATAYRARVSRYRSNGGPLRWHLEIRRDEAGEAPVWWWRGLVDLLEENPDCTAWMM